MMGALRLVLTIAPGAAVARPAVQGGVHGRSCQDADLGQRR